MLENFNENSNQQLTTIKEWVNDSNEFVVPFDEQLTNGQTFWEWLDYSRKDAAKRAFDKCGFTENVDYVPLHNNVERISDGGFNRIDVLMTTDCAEQFAMMAGTEKGKEVRLNFIKAKKELKKLNEVIANDPIMSLRMAQIKQAERLTEAEQNINYLGQYVREEFNNVKQLASVKLNPEATRQKLNRIVRNVVRETNKGYNTIWSMIYDRLDTNFQADFSRRMNSHNAYVRSAKASGELKRTEGKCYTSLLDFLQHQYPDYLSDMYEIAKEMFEDYLPPDLR